MLFSQNKGKFAFFLGNNPQVSKSEIKSVLRLFRVEYNELFASNFVLIIDTQDKVEVNKLQERLGGTIKIAKLINLVSEADLESEIFKLIKSKLGKEKFQFGFSLYGINNISEFKKLGLSLKRQLKEKDTKLRFITSRDTKLSSVIIQKEKLIDQGLDIVIIKDKEYYLGNTLTVQDYKSYSTFDYSRPSRDDKSGMLPPKVAKMMINLSEALNDEVILDPFCGSGTILQEALLMGFSNVKGSDISDKAIRDTENNINWLETKLDLDISNVEIKKQDAQKISHVFNENSIGVIITEPYLGPPDRTSNSVINELSELYINSFKEFHKVLNEKGVVIFILPITDNGRIDILEEIEKIIFKKIDLSDDSRGSVIYSREKQRVKREIFKFEKI